MTPANTRRDWFQIQPALRAPDERFQILVSVAWSPGTESYALGVTVVQSDDELRSEVVAPAIGWEDLRVELDNIRLDCLDLVRRSQNPFDPLV